MHHSPELKIKLISLGYESRTIRRIEQKMRKAARVKTDLFHLRDKAYSLRQHRLGLRPSSRNTLLAYGFLKDKAYKTIENRRYTDPNWSEILRMAQQYSGQQDSRAISQRFERWKQEAGEHDVRVCAPAEELQQAAQS